VRRFIAALSLLTLANVVFALGGSACPLAGSTHGVAATVPSDHSGHEGHHTGATQGPAATELADEMSHPPDCLTMGPCALILDVAGDDTATPGNPGANRVVAASDHLPPSTAFAPELPPPRT